MHATQIGDSTTKDPGNLMMHSQNSIEISSSTYTQSTAYQSQCSSNSTVTNAMSDKLDAVSRKVETFGEGLEMIKRLIA